MAPPSLLSWTLRFFHSQLLVRIPEPHFDLTDQTVIITGSNVGLGLEAARHVARLGASKVILGVRTVSKGEEAADDIAKTTGYDRSRVEVWELDMSDTASIQQFAKRAQSLDRLDAAILNAGVCSPTKWTEYNGVESHLSVNVLGTLLLTYLLLPIMAASSQHSNSRGRMTIVGSDMMYLAQQDQLRTTGTIMDKLRKEDLAQIGSRYELSKLLVFWAINDLASKQPLSKSNVLLSVMSPGACQSTLFRDDQSLALKVGFALFARSTEVGARSLVDAIKPDLPDAAHGLFLLDNHVDFSSKELLTGQGQQDLSRKWIEELRTYLEDNAPGLTRV